MEMKLEVVPIPVTDIDRAISFYRDQAGFTLDHDVSGFGDIRFVQFTPPGSDCSIVFGDGIVDMPPGSVNGVILVVDDIETARSELTGRGTTCSPIQHYTETGLAEGKGGDWNSYIFFSDPDGNGWTVQERPASARA